MEEREFIGDIVNLHVVGNYVTLQPGSERFSKRRIRVHKKRLSCYGNKYVCVDFSFGIQNARFDCTSLTRFAKIVRCLSIEESKPVRSRDTKFRASGKIEKNPPPPFDICCHSCPDDSRLSNCLRKPRRNPVVSLPAPVLANSPDGVGATSDAALRRSSCSSSTESPTGSVRPTCSSSSSSG